jgi:hypothetical protein
MVWTNRSGAIADAQLTWLNLGTQDWQTPKSLFTAVRVWAADKTLPELAMGDLIVEVLPFSIDVATLSARARKKQDYVTTILFRQKYIPASDAPNAEVTNAWVDANVAIVENVADKLFDLSITGQPTGFQVEQEKVEISELCNGAWLLDASTYVGTIDITWREYRAR